MTRDEQMKRGKSHEEEEKEGEEDEEVRAQSIFSLFSRFALPLSLGVRCVCLSGVPI